MSHLTLRDLRLWHWRNALAARRNQHAHERDRDWYIEAGKPVPRGMARNIRDNELTANFHIKAVQALNDVVDGTAECDEAASAAKGPTR